MEKKEFFYVRVSTKEQNEARQLEKAKELGIDPENIYIDKQSGKDFNREKYQELKRHVRRGDTIFVHSLDRLGRNSRELRNEWEDFLDRGVDIVVANMPILDTRQHKDSLGSFVAELIFTVLSYQSQSEREFTLERQKEGIAAAKKSGKYLGRPIISLKTLNRGQVEDIKKFYPMWKNGDITAVAFAAILELKKNTFYKIMKEYERSLPQSTENT